MNTITVQTTVNAPIAKVWEYWNNPEHIINWAFASLDWEAPSAENDLRVSGKFKITMAAKDKSSSFDFMGTYVAVKENELIEYDTDGYDGQGGTSRHVKVEFSQVPDGVKIMVIFDPETENLEEMQRAGWQTILDNFKKYIELRK